MRGFGIARRFRPTRGLSVALVLPEVGRNSDLARAVVLRANALAEQHDVQIVIVTSSPGRSLPGLDPRIRVRDVVTPSAAEAGSRVLMDLEADVVVTSTPELLAAAALAVPRGTTVIHQEPAVFGTETPPALRAFAARADVIVTSTEAGANLMRARLGAGCPPIQVLSFQAPASPASPLDRPTILAAGRADGQRQHDHLVRAFARVAHELPDWTVRLVGSGPGRRRLQALADMGGFGDRIQLPRSADDMALEMRSASIAVLTSRTEGDPLAILDAMSAGLPLVAYDCPTVPGEVITHGVDGFLTPQDDEAAIAEHLLRLAHDPALRRRVGNAARLTVERFDREAIDRSWREIVARAVAARPSSGAPPVSPPPPAEDRTSRVRAAVPVLTPLESRRALLGWVVRAMVPIEGWFVLPQRGELPPTLVVPDSQRATTLAALGRAGLPGWVSVVVAESDGWQTGRGDVPDMCRELAGRMVRGFSLEPWPVVDARVSHLCDAAGIRIEFWLRDRAGALHSPAPNAFASLVEPEHVGEMSVDGVTAPSLVALPGPYYDECTFPIDAVYTWVDDGDVAWRAAKAQALAAAPDSNTAAASGDARFRNRDELRYSLRSVYAHAPWIRTIHLVTAGQRPAWLIDHPRVSVVDHTEILPADALPTFNSHAIETALHRIDGLSEHFLYFNDDFFLGHPLTPRSFFTPGGLPNLFTAPGPIGVPGTDARPYAGAAMVNRGLLRERFGVTITQHLFHMPYALRRSLLDQTIAAFPDAVARTARARFRSGTDVSLVSSLAPHYGLLAGSAIEATLPTRFVDVSRPNLEGVLRDLLDREFATFCVGDHHDYALPHEEVDRLLAEFFAQYFALRPPWEAPDHS